MRSRTGVVAGVLLVVSGIVWMLQGLNSRYAPQSFMTNNREWILFGALAAAGGIWLIARSRRPGP